MFVPNFERFAKEIEVRVWDSSDMSYLYQRVKCEAVLEGRESRVVPEQLLKQVFLYEELESVSKLVCAELETATKLLAIKNAWLGVFENYITGMIENGEGHILVGDENKKAINDFLVLNSPYWTKHPVINEVKTLMILDEVRKKFIREEKLRWSMELIDDPDCLAFREHQREKELSDIQFCIDDFQSEMNSFKSIEEIDAWYAQLDINRAQRKISNLKQEIEAHEHEIIECERVVRRFKTLTSQLNAVKTKGRPVNDEFKVNIGKKFVSEWVESLMCALEVKSCQKLEQLISAHSTKLEIDKKTGVLVTITVPSKATERNWRRWRNGEAIPNYNSFVTLMRAKVDFGKYRGKLLQEIPTKPDSSQLQALLRFI